MSDVYHRFVWFICTRHSQLQVTAHQQLRGHILKLQRGQLKYKYSKLSLSRTLLPGAAQAVHLREVSALGRCLANMLVFITMKFPSFGK